MNFDKFDNRYRYYLYASNDVVGCIENGIQMSSGNVLDRSLFLVNSYIINDNLDEFINGKYNGMNNFIIIKIPVYYMGWRHRNGIKEPYFPMFKYSVNKNTLLKEIYLVPELIYSVYNRNTQTYTYNDKYNVFYDPNGLQFCNEQIGNMFEYGHYWLYQDAFSRQNVDYDELREMDIANCVWEKTIKYYKASKVKRKILNIKKNDYGIR